MRKRETIATIFAALAWSVLTVPVFAQDTDVTGRGQVAPRSPEPAAAYDAIDPGRRVAWIVDGSIGRRSLTVGVMSSVWQTAWDTPPEWRRSWSGMALRYAEREVDVTISNTLEARLGAIFGEEPRYYIPSGRHGIGARTRYAAKTVFLAQRRDGHLASVGTLRRQHAEQRDRERVAAAEHDHAHRHDRPQRQWISRPDDRQPLRGVLA